MTQMRESDASEPEVLAHSGAYQPLLASVTRTVTAINPVSCIRTLLPP